MTAMQGVGPADGDPAARLERARLLDWRLLLPDPTPGTAVLAGTPADGLATALAEAGWSVVSPGVGGADLAIVDEPTRADLAATVAAVRPGGWIHVRCRGALGRGPAALGRRSLGPRAVRQALTDAGCVVARTYLPVPPSAPKALVPLDEPAPLRLLLGHRGGWLAMPPIALGLELARRVGLLSWLAPAVGIVAQRPTEDPTGARVSSTAAPQPPAASLGRAASPLLLTPRFRASRNVVALLPDDRGRRPAVVAKVGRIPGPSPTAEREARALAALAALGDEGSGQSAVAPVVAPRLIEAGERWGLPTIVEEALHGPLLDPATVRRDPDAAAALGLEWLASLVRTDTPPVGAAARLDRLARSPLAAFAAALPQADGLCDLVTATIRTAEALGDPLLPAAVEHGDASHPNLVRTPHGLAAVDWELGEPDGLPGHDLASFLAYVHLARARARTPSERSAELARLVIDPPAWARDAQAAYAARVDLDPSLLAPLLEIAWARHLLGLVGRVVDRTPSSIEPGLAEWLGTHRYAAAWRAAVAARGSS